MGCGYRHTQWSLLQLGFSVLGEYQVILPLPSGVRLKPFERKSGRINPLSRRLDIKRWRDINVAAAMFRLPKIRQFAPPRFRLSIRFGSWLGRSSEISSIAKTKIRNAAPMTGGNNRHPRAQNRLDLSLAPLRPSIRNMWIYQIIGKTAKLGSIERKLFLTNPRGDVVWRQTRGRSSNRHPSPDRRYSPIVGVGETRVTRSRIASGGVDTRVGYRTGLEFPYLARSIAPTSEASASNTETRDAISREMIYPDIGERSDPAAVDPLGWFDILARRPSRGYSGIDERATPLFPGAMSHS